MSVFRNYNSKKAGGVNANAFPNVHTVPWDPTQRNVRANPGIPSQPQRIQPHERGTWFPTSSSGGGTLAPSMGSSTDCSGGCGGCGGGGDATSATPSAIATQHTFPAARGTIARAVPRPQTRGIGALRSGIRGGQTISARSMSAGIGGRMVR